MKAIAVGVGSNPKGFCCKFPVVLRCACGLDAPILLSWGLVAGIAHGLIPGRSVPVVAPLLLSLQIQRNQRMRKPFKSWGSRGLVILEQRKFGAYECRQVAFGGILRQIVSRTIR